MNTDRAKRASSNNVIVGCKCECVLQDYGYRLEGTGIPSRKNRGTGTTLLLLIRRYSCPLHHLLAPYPRDRSLPRIYRLEAESSHVLLTLRSSAHTELPSGWANVAPKGEKSFGTSLSPSSDYVIRLTRLLPR